MFRTGDLVKYKVNKHTIGKVVDRKTCGRYPGVPHEITRDHPMASVKTRFGDMLYLYESTLEIAKRWK